MTRYICKACGAESPAGIGYVGSVSGPLSEPASDCPNQHVEREAAMSEYLVTEADLGEDRCECGHATLFHQSFGCIGTPQRERCRDRCKRSAEDIRLAHLDSIVRREVIAELSGAAEEWDALEAKGYDPLSPAEIAGNLRARVMVLREMQGGGQS